MSSICKYLYDRGPIKTLTTIKFNLLTTSKSSSPTTSVGNPHVTFKRSFSSKKDNEETSPNNNNNKSNTKSNSTRTSSSSQHEHQMFDVDQHQQKRLFSSHQKEQPKVASTSRPATASKNRKPIIGLALGSGSAKGWAHIGVIRALEKHGIYPDVISGTSIGALVGGAYAAGKLDLLESFTKSINWRNYVALTDFSLLKMDVSGIIYGDKIYNYMVKEAKEDFQIETLKKPFAAVATDLRTGKEVWLQRGSLFRAIRASIAIPGLFAPVKDLERSTKYHQEWLVDGALTNPVPVSLCRALGADLVIAVNLNRNTVVKSFPRKVKSKSFEGNLISSILTPIPRTIQETASSISEYVFKAKEYFASNANELKVKMEEEHQKNARNGHPSSSYHTTQHYLNNQSEMQREEEMEEEEEGEDNDNPPHMIKVMTTAINIMQNRIVSSRLAGDPPEIEINPKLAGMDTFDFEKADFAIKSGYNSVEHSLNQIKDVLEHYQ